ncbi:MAG TPA: hypothetical protein VGK18_10725 [Propionicimonas sp.]
MRTSAIAALTIAAALAITGCGRSVRTRRTSPVSTTPCSASVTA